MYRRLFWECGLIGQVLYLEAEAAGVRGTGIGCFYDDAGARDAGPLGPRVAKPLPLLRRRAGRGHAARDVAGVRVGERGRLGPAGQVYVGPGLQTRTALSRPCIPSPSPPHPPIFTPLPHTPP